MDDRKGIVALGSSAVVFACALACSFPTALTPPPPIGPQMSEGSPEATSTFTTQLGTVVGTPTDAYATRGAQAGGTAGLSYQATRYASVRLGGAIAPGGSAGGGVGRVAVRFNSGFGRGRTRTASNASTDDAEGRRHVRVGVTIEVGVGAGAYNARCARSACGTYGDHGYWQADLAAHTVVAVFGVVDLFAGFAPAVGSILVSGSDQQVFYLGADTGVRVRLPSHVALMLDASYHSATAGAVSLQDPDIAQLSFAIQWTSPPVRPPVPPLPPPVEESESPSPSAASAPPTQLAPVDVSASPAPTETLPTIDVQSSPAP